MHTAGFWVACAACMLALAHGDCLSAKWMETCDYVARKCVIMPCLCAPQNSLPEAIATARGDNWVIEVWPYTQCGAAAFDGVPANAPYSVWKEKAHETLTALERMLANYTHNEHVTHLRGFSVTVSNPANVLEWPQFIISSKNLTIRGFGPIAMGVVKMTAVSAVANAQNRAIQKGLTPLCVPFWTTAPGLQIENFFIDLEECCNAYTESNFEQVQASDCAAVRCSGTDCSGLRLTRVGATGAGMGVLIATEENSAPLAHNVSVNFYALSTLPRFFSGQSVALMWWDAIGSATVSITISGDPLYIVAKTGSHDATFTFDDAVRMYNISALLPSELSLFTSKILHLSADNIKVASPMTWHLQLILIILVGVLLLLVIMQCLFHSRKSHQKID